MMVYNSPKSSKTITFLLCFLTISIYILLSSVDESAYSSSRYASVVPTLSAAAVFLLVLLVILAVRTTVVAWITVLVLLAFTGNRRRVLVKNGRKITSDVAMYLIRVVIKERSLAAVAWGTIFSAVTMAWVTRFC